MENHQSVGDLSVKRGHCPVHYQRGDFSSANWDLQQFETRSTSQRISRGLCWCRLLGGLVDEDDLGLSKDEVPSRNQTRQWKFPINGGLKTKSYIHIYINLTITINININIRRYKYKYKYEYIYTHYTYKNGGFSFAMFDYWRVSPKSFRYSNHQIPLPLVLNLPPSYGRHTHMLMFDVSVVPRFLAESLSLPSIDMTPGSLVECNCSSI